MHQHIHHVGGRLWLTHTCKYMEPYRTQAERWIGLALKCSILIPRHFNLDPEARYLIKPIKKKITRGSYKFWCKMIEIDPIAQSDIEFVRTMVHESVHCEQYFEGRLRQNFENGKIIYLWDNQVFSDSKTHQEYLNLPWEIEARTRADAFIRDVLGR